ncbi:tyrosine-type recombinase/integrase [Lysinibacillus sp. BW-2-10]|uniref:tyrosine-type recombinase/integrase n=1 Tax=Lysinibacillus sp. BW-2-10 TaxID=2590030 RepID=UPI00117E32E8|nr:tyrosine-type recombinase/integrase [Lysinibacillus sp. BW-2-10]TSI07373.1 tyrosine-type recombinase/integrase [Lysinibacillus sp. BW-2-10]
MDLSKKYWISTNETINKETRNILNEYLLNLKLANKAEATITKYKSILEIFLSECTIPLDELTSENILSWIQIYSVNKKEKTVLLVLSTLTTFFNFCLAEEYIERVLLKKRWRPKIPQSLPKYLNEQEYSRVKVTAEQLSLRDRGLVLFLLSSGCRRSEVAQLIIEDVDFDKRTVQVKGKGNKIRNVHFSIECALVIKEYLSTRKYTPTDPLFLNRWGQPLQQNGIYKVTKNLGELAELPQRLHPHCCRHTFATHLLAKGAELQFIADEMGHTNLNTTRVYARIPTEDMIIAYQNIMG